MVAVGLSISTVSRVDTPCFYNYNRLENSVSCRDDGLLVHYMTPYTWGQLNEQGRLPVYCGEAQEASDCGEECKQQQQQLLLQKQQQQRI